MSAPGHHTPAQALEGRAPANTERHVVTVTHSDPPPGASVTVQVSHDGKTWQSMASVPSMASVEVQDVSLMHLRVLTCDWTHCTTTYSIGESDGD